MFRNYGPDTGLNVGQIQLWRRRVTINLSTMRAAILTGYGQPLDVAVVPRPVPGAGQILVHLQACGPYLARREPPGGDTVAIRARA
jgi:hypothetical protein